MLKSSIFLCLLAAVPCTALPDRHPRAVFSPRTKRALSLSGGDAALLTLDRPLTITGYQLYETNVAAGVYKASGTFKKIFTLGIVSGFYIGFGGFLAITVGGNCPGLEASNPGLHKMVLGSFGLPVGLILTLVTGAQLFTGNTMVCMAAMMEGQIKLKDLLKNWVGSYSGNFVGAVALAYMAHKTGTLAGYPGAAAIATKKCSSSFDVTFTKAVIANWLVCIAVYMANGCSTMIGKMLSAWVPVSAFTAMGMEHSIANMCMLPLGMLNGADITWGDIIIKNLIPVTLGNIFGGAICSVAPFGLTFGNWFGMHDSFQ